MKLIALAVLAALLASCSAINDPAVQLAYCLEHAVKANQEEVDCKLGLPRGGVGVLHPDGDLTSEQLVAAGLTASQAEEIRQLRLNAFASIYVLTNDPEALPSRTTYQRGFVRIPQLLVAARSSNEAFTLRIAGPPSDRYVEALR